MPLIFPNVGNLSSAVIREAVVDSKLLDAKGDGNAHPETDLKNPRHTILPLTGIPEDGNMLPETR
jgi:hypothetical protein